MELSYEAIDFCRKKYDNGSFWDMEDMITDEDEDLSPESYVHIFDDLWKNQLISTIDDEIHISALGHHILNMIIRPEIYIRIDNNIKNSRSRIYLKNTYYLLVLERETDSHQVIVELLPDLKYLVGAIISAIDKKDEIVSAASCDDGSADSDIKVYGNRLNMDRCILDRLEINGNYHDTRIDFQVVDPAEGNSLDRQVGSDQISFINLITKWILKQLADSIGEQNEFMDN